MQDSGEEKQAAICDYTYDVFGIVVNRMFRSYFNYSMNDSDTITRVGLNL